MLNFSQERPGSQDDEPLLFGQLSLPERLLLYNGIQPDSGLVSPVGQLQFTRPDAIRHKALDHRSWLRNLFLEDHPKSQGNIKPFDVWRTA